MWTTRMKSYLMICYWWATDIHDTSCINLCIKWSWVVHYLSINYLYCYSSVTILLLQLLLLLIWIINIIHNIINNYNWTESALTAILLKIRGNSWQFLQTHNVWLSILKWCLAPSALTKKIYQYLDVYCYEM